MRGWSMFLLLLLPCLALAQKAELVDRIVAIVNKEVITNSELNAAIASAERQLRRQGTALPPRAVLERQILERLVLDRAQLQKARDTGIRVDDVQLDRAVQRIAENNKMTEEQFVQHLKGLGVDASTLRERFRAMIGWREVIRRRFSALVSVTQREIDRAVSASGSDGGDDGVELSVQKLTLSLPTSSDQAAMAKRFAEAEALRRKFGGCKSMAALAKDAAGSKFEDLKFIKPSSIAEPTRTLLLSAKDGDMLPPSAAPGAIDLFAVCARRTVKADEKQREKVQEDLRAKEFEMLAKRHLRDIRQDAHIEFR